MYQKDKSILCRNSASPLPNNLTSCAESGKINLAFAGKTEVNTLFRSSDGSVQQSQVACKDVGGSPCTEITQVKWVKLDDIKTLLVIASTRALQVFEWDGSVFLHCHPIPQELDAAEETFTRGIGTCGPSLLCVGTNSGTILVHLVSRDLNITFCQRATEHAPHAVADIHSHGEIMASVDDGGGICLWRGKTALSLMRKLPPAGAPCVSVRVWHDLVLASYGTGELRVFSTRSFQLMAEAVAHARWITAIDVAPDTGLALSVAEDSYVRVWQLDREGEHTIDHVYGESVADALLVGCAFLAPDGNAFAAVAYDSGEVFMFKK
ncbi:WD repeat-containing protein 54-like [Haemaphysalis longicornis]